MIAFPLAGRAAAFYVLTILSFLGTVAGVALLFTSTTKVCDAVGCQQVADYTELGWYVFVGGIVQTVLLLTIGQLCSVLGHVVAQVNSTRVGVVT